ncbi:hypothetical protein [Variovorax sp. J31P207]|uniref:hypothetical protein n=1 Tax=Variovorax sp. J31P207 TaxID=3053510 RepID=UPI00257763B8|nr:hypothetical protein [Variovorax sp. J31P207]MDM0071993.1 hypothetical protein [Variovorax sp. J31P207]
MRMLGLVGLLVALVVVGLLARKQLGGVAAPVLPAGGAAAGEGRAPNPQQIQQQFKQSLDAAMQARPVPDDN